MNDRIEHPQVRVPFLKRLGKLLESCRSPFTIRRLAAAVVLVADLEDDLMEKPLLLALFNVPIVVRDLISRLGFLCVVLRKGFIEKLVVDLFQIFPAQRDVLLGSGRILYHSLPLKSPLCYFLCEKVTQKHFPTSAPLVQQ